VDAFAGDKGDELAAILDWDQLGEFHVVPKG
jgi:hypothetical protein